MPRILILLGISFISCFVGTFGGAPSYQDGRLFADVCDNCTVSGGLGFVSYPQDCSCFYTCVLYQADKLASYATPWVSYLRCCPCCMTFSSKLLTCVDYTDKRSDCYNDDIDNNPCETTGNITRPDPNDIFGPPLCSGFHTCVQIGNDIVPKPDCCTEGLCYNTVTMDCDTASCGSCPKRETDDCECDDTPKPEKECAFLPVTNNIFQFMGRENMKTYNCSLGTCWDQNTCTCVRTNNTGYNDCVPFAELDFDNNDPNARDRYGNIIYTTVSGGVSISGEDAFFNGGNITVSGLANTWLSNRFALHFDFRLTDREGVDANECLVGSCTDLSSEGNDTFAIVVENEEGGGDNIFIYVTYKDSHFWIPGTDTIERVALNLEAEYETGTLHEFWLFYGYNELLIAGVLEGTFVTASGSVFVEETKTLVNPASGFVFGECMKGNSFIGELDNIELFRNCEELPPDNTEYSEAYDQILGSLSGP